MQNEANLEASWNPIKRGRTTYYYINNVNKSNIFSLSKKVYLQSESVANKVLRVQAKFFSEYTIGTLIKRESIIRKKHESTSRKGTKYTVNKYKLTFKSAVFQPRSTFATNCCKLQRMLGAFTHLARYPRELLSWQYSRVIHIWYPICDQNGWKYILCGRIYLSRPYKAWFSHPADLPASIGLEGHGVQPPQRDSDFFHIRVGL